MRNFRKGLWAVVLGLGFVFTPGLILVLTNESITNDNTDKVEVEQNKSKTKKYISATCDIDPNNLNFKSKGKWITAYIELPEDYDVYDIVLGEILLNDFLSPEVWPFNIQDNNNNEIPDLMIKFNRSSVISNLEPSQFCEVKITGKLVDGLKFKATSMLELKNF